ncbi:FmdB family zinc ribbon protein [Chloroflexota bacterium]
MPIYEYECENCSCRFELKRRFDEDAESPCCPQCQGKVRQLISPSAIIFKGSGFYVTDSRNDLNRQSEEGKAEGDKKEGVKAEGDKKEGVKAEGSKKEGGKTESSKKEGGKTESSKKEEGKADKVEGSKKSESK